MWLFALVLAGFLGAIVRAIIGSIADAMYKRLNKEKENKPMEKTTEELLADTGGTNALENHELWAQISERGEAAYAPVFRAATEAAFRTQLWNDWGRAKYDGTLFFRRDNPEGKGPRLDGAMFGKMLQSQAVSWLSSHPKRREPPLSDLIQSAKQQFAADHPPLSRAALGIPDNPWTRYLDACGRADFAAVEAYLSSPEGERKRQEALDAGMFGALSALVFGENVSSQHARLVEFLIERGGDIDTSLHANMTLTALHWTARDARVESVRWLLDHGAGVNFPDGDGRTALMCALEGDGRTDAQTEQEQREVIRLLLERGADLSFQEKTSYPASERMDAFDFIGPTAADFSSPAMREWLESLGYELPAPTYEQPE